MEINMTKENNVYRGLIGNNSVILMKRINEDEICIKTYGAGRIGNWTCVAEISKVEEFFTVLFRAVTDIMHKNGQVIQQAGFLDSNGDVLCKVFVRTASRSITALIGDFVFTLYMGNYNPGIQIGDNDFDNECIFRDIQSIVEWLRNSEEDE